MARNSSLGGTDSHDPKEFRETLGSFGTTTVPGGNQLVELQTKVRQGVKHVELHLASSGKGQFNQQDVPDKYGFEQRRTIMQLAKMNQQTLSVHGTFEINSFAGLSNQGFDEAARAKSIKEIDETVKFAAETAKGGAVVFHLHETALPPTPPGEINLPDKYLKWLKEHKPQEYERVMQSYLKPTDLDRRFVDNPDLESEMKVKFNHLSDEERNGFKDWREYYQYYKDEQIKLEQEGTPLVVVGNSIQRASRQQDLVDIENGYKQGFNEKEKEYLKQHGITEDPDLLTIDDFQRIQANFINKNRPDTGNLNRDEFNNLRSKFILEYVDVLNKNDRMKSKSDKEFFQKTMDMQIRAAQLQKEDLDRNKKRYSKYLDEIEDIKQKERRLLRELDLATDKGDKRREQEIIRELNGGMTEEDQSEMQRIQQKAESGTMTEDDRNRFMQIRQKGAGLKGRKWELEVQEVGQIEYQKLDRYDEMMGQLNEQIKKAREQKQNARVMTDEIFDKNSSAMAHLGIKAMSYQLDLLNRSKTSKQDAQKINREIEEIQQKMNSAESADERNKLHVEMMKKKYELRNFTGVSDYDDINLKENPLYLAPENIMAGYGYMDSLEEYKAVIRSSWQEFAHKILSDETSYKKIREDYERTTGEKITKENVEEIAKRHIGGTFDNAHAGVWLKYFKREAGESEEARIDRFNKWLNDEAENMAREGIIKHIHFNDTQAKDDDHNLLGSGILDIHDWRERLRKAGIKESLIVEAGGRGGNEIMHVLNAFDIFSPQMRQLEEVEGRGYNANHGGRFDQGGRVSNDVSDWMTVKRNYEGRMEYSQYGLGYSSFKPNQPPQGRERGDWSGMTLL
jgi:hypothetical protein